MAKMPSVTFVQANTAVRRFSSRPIGLVLHRTEGHYANFLAKVGSPNPAMNPEKHSAHFIIGKNPGEVTQMVDTDFIANHAKDDANVIYLGIEFESIPDTRPKRLQHGQDPATNADWLTPFQASAGWDVVEWVCRTHGIPKHGPPTRAQMRACNGRWQGVLSHNDLSEARDTAHAKLFRTTHGDELEFLSFMMLGIPPVP